MIRVKRTFVWALLLLSASMFIPGTVSPISAQSPAPADRKAGETQRFIVLGHVRGIQDGKLPLRFAELLGEVRELAPDFVILAGDNIWGDPGSRPAPADSAWVVEQWTALDSALAELQVPVYRVPGNHDIQDAVTRDIYRDRYGTLPASVDVGRTRLILLTTTWDDARPDRRPAVRGGGYHLDRDQLDFLEARLAEHDGYDHAFVVMHHVLWWERDDSPWWTEVHPILAAEGVDAVFTGDYGPVKFSHTDRDGVDYFQVSIAGDPTPEQRRSHEWNRLLAAQFDNYLLVEIGDSTRVTVETVGEVSSGHFTPEMWWDVHGSIRRPSGPGRPSGRDYLARLWAIPRGRLVVLGALSAVGILGLVFGLMIGRRRT